MSCIKTGAKVYLTEYNQTLPADIFRVGGCLIIQLTMALFNTRESNWSSEGATHHVVIGDGYWSKNRGVIVVPNEQVTEV